MCLTVLNHTVSYDFETIYKIIIT